MILHVWKASSTILDNFYHFSAILTWIEPFARLPGLFWSGFTLSKGSLSKSLHFYGFSGILETTFDLSENFFVVFSRFNDYQVHLQAFIALPRWFWAFFALPEASRFVFSSNLFETPEEFNFILWGAFTELLLDTKHVFLYELCIYEGAWGMISLICNEHSIRFLCFLSHSN